MRCSLAPDECNAYATTSFAGQNGNEHVFTARSTQEEYAAWSRAEVEWTQRLLAESQEYEARAEAEYAALEMASAQSQAETLELLGNVAMVADIVTIPSGEGFAIKAALKEAAEEALERAWHHTAEKYLRSIMRDGLRPGQYATPKSLSPLQAKIELALPGNLPRNSVIEVDIAGLRSAGYEIPAVTRVSSYAGLPGGGYEMHFPYAIPPEFLRVIQ